MSLRKIKPLVSNPTSLTKVRPASGDAVSIPDLTIITFQCFLCVYEIKELPNFEPNDYFWKNHWQEGKEEKWEAFARAMREIMADVGGFKLSELSMEHKLEYKNLIRGKSNKKTQ